MWRPFFGEDLDVPVPGLRMAGLDADRQQARAIRCAVSTATVQDAQKLFVVLDDMVGRQHDHDSVRIDPADMECSEADARCGIPADRFVQDILFGNIRQLFREEGPLHPVGDDEEIAGIHRAGQASGGTLDHGFFAGDLERLLGGSLSAAGPEAGAHSPGHHDAKDLCHASAFRMKVMEIRMRRRCAAGSEPGAMPPRHARRRCVPRWCGAAPPPDPVPHGHVQRRYLPACSALSSIAKT